MKIEYLICILISAFFHALYHFFLRKKSGNRIYLLLILSTAFIISVILTLGYSDLSLINWSLVPFVFCASTFYFLYQIFVTKTYARGEISSHYPLTVLSPIFVPVWALIFLNERLSFLSGTGIIITVLGAFLVKMNSINLKEFKKILSFHKDYTVARFAILASIMYSFAAIFDKSKISHFQLLPYLSLLLIFMILNLSLYIWRFDRQPVDKYFKQHWKSIIAGGIVLFLSFFFYRIALKELFVGIVVPIRLTSIIFAILLGVFALKEKVKISKLVGALIVIMGIILITFGV